MNLIEAIRIAFQSLWANKLRSALTLLGVVIGIAAVIAVVTFVAGINGYVATKVFNLGADVFIVFKVSPVTSNIDHLLDGEKRKTITMEDYEAVKEACKHCEWVGRRCAMMLDTRATANSKSTTRLCAASRRRWCRFSTSI